MAGAIPDIVIRLTADVDDFIRDWDRAADAAERAAARIRAAGAAAGDGPDASRFRDLNAELERLTRTARQAADSIRDLGNNSRRLGDDVDELGRRVRDLGDGTSRVGSSVGSMGSKFPPVTIAIGVLASLLPGVVAGLFALGAAGVGVAAAVGVMVLGARGLGQAFAGLERTIEPLKRQLDSVFRAELSQEMIKLGQTISTQLAPSFKEVARAISDVIKETSQWIRSAEGINTIKTMMGGVKDLVRELGPAVKGIVQIFLEFGASAAPSMGKIGAAISEVITGLRDMFREAQKSGQLTKIFEAGAEAIKGFGEIIKGIIAILMEMASQGGLPAAEAMKKLGKAMQEAAPAIGAAFAAAAKLANVFATVIEVIAKVVKWFDELKIGGQSLGGVIMGAISPLTKLADTVDKLTKVFPQAIAAVDKFAQEVAKGFAKVVLNVVQAVPKAIAAVKEWWTKTTSDIKQGVDKAIQEVKKFGEKIVAEAKAFVDKVIQTVKEWWDKTVAAVKEGADKVIEKIKEMAEKVVEKVKELPAKFLEAGKDMVMGLIKGAEQMAGQLIKVFEDMAKRALQALKAALGISSPSKVFAEEVGVWIPAGVAQGIKAGTPALQSALAASMRTLPMTANVALAGASHGSALGLGGQGRQVIEVKLDVGSGGDGAAGAMIAGLARRGQLKLTSNAIVGGRR